MLKIDEQTIASKLESFTREKLELSGTDGYVIGLSGGIDSALSASIAVKACGSEKLFGYLMPYKHSSSASVDDAKELAEKLKIKTEQVDISPMISAYYKNIDQINPVQLGNKMARERMSILFDRAFASNRLVLGTSNRTEICLGYGTWFGDVACSVNPIGMLYKTEIRQLAKYYGVPDSIITKPPTADTEWSCKSTDKKADNINILFTAGFVQNVKLQPFTWQRQPLPGQNR